MKYKYCPDCGSKMTHSRSSDGCSEQYDCDTGCHLRIEIVHGETMHAELPREKWIRPEPRKPREWYAEIPLDGSVGQIFTNSRQLTKGGELVKVREVIDDDSEAIKEAFRKAVDRI